MEFSMSGIQQFHHDKDFHFYERGGWAGDMFPRVPWPPPAHQADIYPRGYGLYSLFPATGDPYNTPAFPCSPKVTEPLFTFTGGGHLPLSPHPTLQQLEVLTKTFTPPHEQQNNGHCFPSPARTPRPRATPNGSPVTVIDLSTDPTKKPPTVKQETLHEPCQRVEKIKKGLKPLSPCPKGVTPLRVGVPTGCNKLGLSSPSEKLGLVSPGRPMTFPPGAGGCSRTTPMVVVKKEPLLSPVDTSAHGAGSVFLSPPSDSETPNNVKIETEAEGLKTSVGNGGIGMERYPPSPPCISSNTAPLLGAVCTGGGVCDDRGPSLMPSWPNPTLWQYPGVDQYAGCPPVGYQLIRDPMTGHLMLIPAASMEAVQRAILWPSYASNGGPMVLPPPNAHHLSSTHLPSTPHLVLESGVPSSIDLMTPESAHQPGTPRRILITTEQSTPPTLIKLESSGDCPSSAVVVTSCDNSLAYSKAGLSSVASETVFYPSVVDSPARPLKLNDTETRAQVSPPMVNSPPCITMVKTPPPMESPVPRAASPPLRPPSRPTPLDVTGLELLSNSIEKHSVKVDNVPPAPPPTPSTPLGGFAMLCALAEQLRGSEGQEGREGAAPPLPRQLDTPPVSPLCQTEDLSPPILEKVTDITYEELVDISRPPKLTPHTPTPVCDSDIQHGGWQDGDYLRKDKEGRKRSASSDFPPPPLKKRKVGRPRKTPLCTENLLAEKKTPTEATKLRKIRPRLKAEPKTKIVDEVLPSKNRRTAREVPSPVTSERSRLSPVVAGESPVVAPDRSRLSPVAPRLSVVLTTQHLSVDQLPLRVLTTMKGEICPGQLSAIRAPDVYGITVDGERGNRPHIFSREEILKDTLLEVKPRSTRELPPGTRLCAYWSGKLRCMYPGTVTVPSESEDNDDKSVSVAFDDDDKGRIRLDDIRLLPPDYPIQKNDPLLSKRKRRVSSATSSLQPVVKLEKIYQCKTEPAEEATTEPVAECAAVKLEAMEEDVQLEQNSDDEEVEEEVPHTRDAETERRHLKKKRREKLKRLQSLSADGTTSVDTSSDGRRRHRKHKCSSPHHHKHHKKHRKHRHRHRERLESTESTSKMAAFLPAKQLWGWADKGTARPNARGRAKKTLHKAIRRGRETIEVGDCAVFLSTGRPDRPYIGRIVSLWESWCANMVVKVKWFYHPEETAGCPATLRFPGALFESPHQDENDVQTISHKCEVLPLEEYTLRLGREPWRFDAVYENNDMYYLAGYYDPTTTTLTMEPDVE